jgi:predicted RNA-binding protein with PIN domain
MVKPALIVDGYNLILRLGSGADLAPGELARRRQVLEEHLVLYGKQERILRVVIYDGLRMAGGHLGARRDDDLEVVFADPPAIADDLIFQRARRHLQEARVVQVVTSDGGLAAGVRAEGAQVISVEDFGDALMAQVTSRSARRTGVELMPDIHEHFMAVHRQEELRAGAARQGIPDRDQGQGVHPSSPSPAGTPGPRRQARSAPVSGVPEKPGGVPLEAAARERKKKKGQRRQQRRLNNQTSSSQRRRRR